MYFIQYGTFYFKLLLFVLLNLALTFSSMSAEALSTGIGSTEISTANAGAAAAEPQPATQVAPKKPRRTFYRRPLPSLCTALSSPEGRAIFNSAHKNNGLRSFFPLIEQFSTQSEPSFCGPTTLVVILNAFAVDPRRTWKGPWRWYEESFLNCCIDIEEIKKTGITFSAFACLARCQGLTVDARIGSESSLEEFRTAVEMACLDGLDQSSEMSSSKDPGTESNKFLAVSYSRKSVGQTGSGHFSPVAAYDPSSDQVLVLDTARFKYGPHWMPLETLFNALQPIDPDTGKSRGYFLLSYEFSDHEHSDLPRSILFRSRKSQAKTRSLFKTFLGGKRHSLQQILDFWTKDGSDLDYIWSILDPQLSPMNDDDKALVKNVRSLLTELIEKEEEQGKPNNKRLRESKSNCVDSCGGNACVDSSSDTSTRRTIPLSPIEAIFVVYLATLPNDNCRDVIVPADDGAENDGGAKTATYEQLLSEIELVRYAIETSDKDGYM